MGKLSISIDVAFAFHLCGGKSQYWASRFAGYLSLDTLLTYEKAVLVWVSWIPFGASVLRDSAVSPALDSKDSNTPFC